MREKYTLSLYSFVV